MIDELTAGKPNCDSMSPGLANATRQQLTGIQSMFTGFGARQSITFKGVGPGGADIYHVKFEKASIDYRVWLYTGRGSRQRKLPSKRIAAIQCGTADRAVC